MIVNELDVNFHANRTGRRTEVISIRLGTIEAIVPEGNFNLQREITKRRDDSPISTYKAIDLLEGITNKDLRLVSKSNVANARNSINIILERIAVAVLALVIYACTGTS